MMARGEAPRGYRCSTCGETFPGFGALGNHRRVHARDAAASTPAGPRVRARRARRIEDIGGSPSDTPLRAAPDDLAVPPTGEPSAPPDRGESAASRSGPTVAMPRLVISPEQRIESTREAIRDALPTQVVADLIRSLTRAISELDGAGEAGVLSEIQSAQVAVLVYDSTIDLVVSRFKGDVGSFKMAAAVLLIVLSKGTVHARAIGAKVQTRRASRAMAEAVAPADLNGHDPVTPVGIAVGPRGLTGLSLDDQIRANAQ